MNAPAPKSGDAIGRFRVLAKWASGGMAEIFLARQRGAAGFDKVVALKLMRPEVAESDEFQQMFFEEARTAALLSHPNIVQTFDFGEEDGRVFMAMEFVHGEPLSRVLTVLRRAGRPFPVPLAIEVIREVAAALHYAHTLRDLEGAPLGLVHRDVSPSNVMLGYSGAVKLLDFGIVKATARADRTVAGTVKGKYSYMSPEQVRAQPLDGRSDVFALGAVLWQMLTGRKLFDGDSDAAIVQRVISGEVAPPSELRADCPKELDDIVLRALALDREARFATAHDLSAALAALRARIAPDLMAASAIAELLAPHFAERALAVAKILREAPDESRSFQRVAPQLASALLEVQAEAGSGSSRRSAVVPTATASRPSEEIVISVDAGSPVAPRGRSLVAAALGVALLLAAGVAAYVAPWAAPAQAEPGTVSLRSTPTGATVVRDGAELGTTPLALAVPASGSTWVALRRAGYQERTVEIAAGATGTIEAELRRADEHGTLAVRTRPSGATVLVNGRPERERTPLVISGLWVGERHTIVVTLDGHQPVVTEIDFERERAQTLDLTLDVATGPIAQVQAIVAAEDPAVAPGRPVPGLRRVDARPGVRAATSHAPATQEPPPAPAIEPAAAASSSPTTAPPEPPAPVQPAEPAPRATVRVPAAAAAQPVAPARAVAAAQPSVPAIAPTVSLGSVRIDGIIDSVSVRRQLGALRASVERCYAQAARERAFEGVASVRFLVGVSGRASRVTVEGPAAAQAGPCIRPVLEGASFPATTSSDVLIRMDLRFQLRR